MRPEQIYSDTVYMTSGITVYLMRMHLHDMLDAMIHIRMIALSHSERYSESILYTKPRLRVPDTSEDFHR